MTARHGERPDTPINAPAPTITSKARSDVWIVDRRTNSKAAGGGIVPTVPVPMDRPAPTLTGKAGGQWCFTSPATTIAGDPRITARCHHDEGSQGANAKTTEQVREGDYEGTEPVKLTVGEALVLQSFDPDYPVQGSKTKQFEQIGNAVPPLLAAHLLAAVLPDRFSRDQS